MTDLKGKNIIVTGASGGIGNSIIEKLNQAGANILASGTRVEKLDELKNKYENIKTLSFDISQSDKIEEFVESATKDLGGNLDCLVNNAGITQDNLLMRMSWEQWKKVIDTNLNSNFLIIKSFLPNMIKNRKGKIIGISSVVASTGNPGQANYVASKAGMIGMYKSIALEVAQRNINVNIVSPGFIKSPMTDKLNEEQQNNIMKIIPNKKFGNPEDIANIVNFLISEEANYITGQTFHVNGGMLMV